MTDRELLELKRFKRRAENDLRILEERNRELLSKLKSQPKAIFDEMRYDIVGEVGNMYVRIPLKSFTELKEKWCKQMKIDDKEWTEKFKSKERLCCAKCGGLKFRAFQLKGKEDVPDMDVSEAVMLTCKDCGHTRLELM